MQRLVSSVRVLSQRITDRISRSEPSSGNHVGGDLGAPLRRHGPIQQEVPDGRWGLLMRQWDALPASSPTLGNHGGPLLREKGQTA